MTQILIDRYGRRKRWTIRRRIDEHRAAGADHGCIQALNPNEARPALPDDQILAAFAPEAHPSQ